MKFLTRATLIRHEDHRFPTPCLKRSVCVFARYEMYLLQNVIQLLFARMHSL